jgi:hypothetical protein
MARAVLLRWFMMNNSSSTIAKLATLVVFSTATACAGTRASNSMVAAPAAPAVTASSDFDRCEAAKVSGSAIDSTVIAFALDAASRGSDECAGLAQRALIQNLKNLRNSSTMNVAQLNQFKALYIRAHSMWGTRELRRGIEQLEAALAIRGPAGFNQPLYAAAAE